MFRPHMMPLQKYKIYYDIILLAYLLSLNTEEVVNTAAFMVIEKLKFKAC